MCLVYLFYLLMQSTGHIMVHNTFLVEITFLLRITNETIKQVQCWPIGVCFGLPAFVSHHLYFAEVKYTNL